jgi:hypothetical protein
MRRLSVVLSVIVLIAAGCSAPTGRRPSVGSDLPTAASSGAPRSRGTPSPSRRSTRPATPTPTGFGELVAVGCNGRPTADQVIALLRRVSLLSSGARPTVTTGPLCAGTWQYTVLTLPDREPLHVVTRGAPESMAVETAGTNPCTARVRANAPAGIVSAIRC